MQDYSHPSLKAKLSGQALRDEEREGWVVDSLVIMNGGSQDIRNLANVEALVDGVVDINTTDIATNSSSIAATVATAAGNISSGAIALRDAGASLVVVSNLFDQGQTPEAFGDAALAAQTLAGGPVIFDTSEPVVSEGDLGRLTSAATISGIRSAGTTAFNQALSADLDGIDGIIVVDQNALVAEVLDNPLRFGLSDEINHRTECAESTPDHPCMTNGSVREIESYFFLNGQDLTTTAHAIIADHTSGVINAPVQVSGLPLTAIASGREIANAGRAQVSAERIARKGWAPFVSAGIGSSTWSDISGEGPHGSLRLTGVAGATYHLGNGFSIGAAASYQDISNSLSGTTIEIEGSSIYGTVFAGADIGNLFGNASVTVGSVDYDEVTRITRIGDASIQNAGETDGNVFGASIEVGYRALKSELVSAGPIASLDHWSADIGAYDEGGWAATGVNFTSDLDSNSTRGSLGFFLEGGDLNYESMPAVFRVKALYTREFDTDPLTVTANTHTSPNNSFSREGRGPQEDSLTIGAQLTYDFGPMIGSLNYNARVGEADDHSGSIDISIPLGGK